MSSIFGIYSDGPKEKFQDELKKMQSAVLEDSGCSTGTYSDEKLGIYVGWTSHPGSFSDCMPIYNHTKDIVLFFNGEDFLDERNLDLLKQDDHGIDRKKASYLIHLYESKGEEFVKDINGIFCGLIVDTRNNTILLFNDRFGLQRIYIHESDASFFFSSKARAISAIKASCRQIDYKSLGEFLSCRAVLENRSLFANIGLLPGGSAWSFQPGKQTRKSSYFSPEQWENQELLEKEEFYQRFKNLFPRIVKQYVDPKDKMALSLTGGLDTRMILAALELAPGQLPSYTHGGMFNESFDVKIARKVADACRQPHKVIEVGADYLEKFHDIALKSVKLTDGHLDVTESVGLYTSLVIKKQANIRLTGNYGSEILRSHVMFKHSMPNAALFDQAFLKQINDAKQTYNAQRNDIHPLTFIAFRQVPWYHYNRFSLEQSLLTQRSPFLDNRLIKLVYQAPHDAMQSTEIPLRFVTEMNPVLGNIRTDRGVGNNDGMISRFCIRAYHEILFKMDYYFNHGMPQWLAKANEYLSPMKLERFFLGRHKYHHFRVWFRDNLAEYLKDILLDAKTMSRPYLDGNQLETVVTDHLSGKQNYSQEISMLLTTELMHRCFFD